MAKSEKTLTKLFWLDMEMTGLDEKKCHILEVAAVVSDLHLVRLDEIHRIVFQPQDILDSMDAWCVSTHGKSGLTEEVKAGRPLTEVEKDLIQLAEKHYKKEEKIVLCGNSIGQDRKFIDLYMPKFAQLLHYRMIDVSSFKEIFKSKYGIVFEKKDNHRAKDDIYESIEELKHYLTFVKLP